MDIRLQLNVFHEQFSLLLKILFYLCRLTSFQKYFSCNYKLICKYFPFNHHLHHQVTTIKTNFIILVLYQITKSALSNVEASLLWLSSNTSCYYRIINWKALYCSKDWHMAWCKLAVDHFIISLDGIELHAFGILDHKYERNILPYIIVAFMSPGVCDPPQSEMVSERKQ